VAGSTPAGLLPELGASFRNQMRPLLILPGLSAAGNIAGGRRRR